MKLFFFCLLGLLAGCSVLSEKITLPDPQDAIITVSVTTPDLKTKSYALPNFTPLGTLLEKIDCPECDLSHLNSLTTLKDGDVIVLKAIAGFSVSINQGNLEELMRLPGIGESLAQRILDYRDTHGFFQRLEDIMRIKGIKQKLFDKIKAFIRL